MQLLLEKIKIILLPFLAVFKGYNANEIIAVVKNSLNEFENSDAGIILLMLGSNISLLVKWKTKKKSSLF